MSMYRRTEGGYTILEVIIVLTVSTLLFGVSIFAYTQQNHRTQFSNSVNEFAQNIEDVLNDVETGFYPSNSDFTCTAGISGPPNPTGASHTQQGTNTDCIFVGKAIQFYPHGSPSNMNVYTIIGRRLVEGSQTDPVSNIDQAKPVGLDRLVDTKSLLSGIQIVSVKAGSTPISGIAAVSSSGIASISTGLNARSRLATIAGNINDSKPTFLNHISSGAGPHLDSSSIEQAKNGIEVCVKEGGIGGRYAIIKLAPGQSQIIVNTEINTSPC